MNLAEILDISGEFRMTLATWIHFLTYLKPLDTYTRTYLLSSFNLMITDV